MATVKAKRSVHPAQPLTKTFRSKSRQIVRTTSKKATYFPEAKGRVVEFIEYFADPSSPNLHLRFQDNTSLSFDFASGFATEAHFSRWKAGNERVPPLLAAHLQRTRILSRLGGVRWGPQHAPIFCAWKG